MVRVIDEQYPMLIAGDSTLAAFYKALAEQGGVGYMHESEGSVITDIWKAGAANYNTALRKAAEHEPISRNRVKGASAIVVTEASSVQSICSSRCRRVSVREASKSHAAKGAFQTNGGTGRGVVDERVLLISQLIGKDDIL